MLKDCAGSFDFSTGNNKLSFSVDLNGKTLTATNILKFNGNAGVNFKNGTITSTGNVSTLIENNGGELDFHSANIDATKLKAGGYIIDSPDGTLYFDRVNVDSNNGTIASNMLTSYGSTIKADILWNNSSVDLRSTTVEGDLFIDEKCIPYYWYWDYPIGKGKGKLGLTYGGDDIIYNEVSNVTIDAGAGNDVIGSYGAGDKISIVGATVTDASVNKNGHSVIKVGKNTVTVKNSSEITLVDGGGEKLFSNGIFYNAGKTSATLPASFSAKGTTKLDARTIDASHVSKAVNITGNDAANSILGSAKKRYALWRKRERYANRRRR